MKSLSRDNNQITLIYSSKTRIGERTRAHISATDNNRLQTIDIVKQQLTGTQWAEIADGLNKPLKELLHYEDTSDDKKYMEGDFDENSIINILNKQPELFTHPVLIKGDEILEITNPTDVQQLIEVDSAGLEKTMMHEEPTISRQTKGEKFKQKPKGTE
ncbi:MAG: hypothetical protein WBG71_11480 [Leeuwenhoekiella sp.]